MLACTATMLVSRLNGWPGGIRVARRGEAVLGWAIAIVGQARLSWSGARPEAT